MSTRRVSFTSAEDRKMSFIVSQTFQTNNWRTRTSSASAGWGFTSPEDSRA